MNNDTRQSQSYQWKFYEVSLDPEVMGYFPDIKDYNQLILEKRDQLLQRIFEVAPTILTKKQFIIFKMYYQEGINTPGIARILDLNTSGVRSNIKGAATNKGKSGALSKLKNYLMKDQQTQNILKEISDLM